VEVVAMTADQVVRPQAGVVEPVLDPGLGNSAYVVDLGDGRALVVDASRDVRAVGAATQRRGLRVAFAADTHLHADFLSGACQLAATDGAVVLASAAGGRSFPHVGMREGDEVDLGGLRLRVLATPGHTEEHVSYLLLDGGTPLGVFTGGSLLVGAAARTDLVSADRTEALARAQYGSLQRLLALPDDVAVWPTHGAGSFCSAPPGDRRTSSIGEERATNPLLQVPDEDAFVAALLGSLGTYPGYFRRLAAMNRRGPAVLDGPPSLARLSIDRVRALLADGAVLLDVRPVADFGSAHVASALSIPLRDVFATWLGWVAPDDRPLVVVRGPDQDPGEVPWQAAKIGYDNVVGELDGGMAAWTAAGHPVARTPVLQPGPVDGRVVLDVRQDSEYCAGHLPGAVSMELGELARRAAEWPDDVPTVVVCAHGARAMTGASLLERAGRRDVAVMVDGPQDWARATGGTLDAGR
jgi:hydroxyacylglutathione hydrolase